MMKTVFFFSHRCHCCCCCFSILMALLRDLDVFFLFPSLFPIAYIVLCILLMLFLDSPMYTLICVTF